jgi:hypothetical protein
MDFQFARQVSVMVLEGLTEIFYFILLREDLVLSYRKH